MSLIPYRKRRRRADEKVFLTIRPDFRRIGRVTALSRTEVCFEYVGPEPGEAASAYEVDLFSESGDFRLSKVACNVIDDVGCGPTFAGGVRTRRCRLRFGALTDRQAAGLRSVSIRPGNAETLQSA